MGTSLAQSKHIASMAHVTQQPVFECLAFPLQFTCKKYCVTWKPTLFEAITNHYTVFQNHARARAATLNAFVKFGWMRMYSPPNSCDPTRLDSTCEPTRSKATPAKWTLANNLWLAIKCKAFESDRVQVSFLQLKCISQSKPLQMCKSKLPYIFCTLTACKHERLSGFNSRTFGCFCLTLAIITLYSL